MSTFRTFRAPDTRSALAMVKAALGGDAIIVATREVENGLFRAKEIEVTAAVPEAPAAPRTPPVAAYAPRASAPVLAPVEPTLAVAPPLAKKPAFDHATDELNSLRSSVEALRAEMRRMSTQVSMERDLKLPPPATELLSMLVHRGVEDSLAEECVRQAVTNAPSLQPQALLSALKNALSERMAPGRAPWLPENRRRVLALVGPTGVGKTTTVAKIAARAVMETRQKVALITVDTYRIGASEQLTRYGEIMGLPTFIARDRAELQRAIEKTANADLVLIDSAGRSVSEAVVKQAEMLRSVEGISLYLTLSACTGPREMAAAAERYRALNPERLVITKVDEAIGPGSLLSASVRIGRPIVAVSDGQRVPEDIHALSSPELVELICRTARSSARVSGGR